MKISLFFAGLLLCLTPTSAQPADPEEIRKQHPGEDAVKLSQKEHLFIEPDAAGALQVRLISEEETLILNASNIAFSTDAIFYTSFSTIENIEAETRTPVSKNRYRSSPVTNIEEQDVMETGIFYSDYKRKKIIYPAVENGSILSLRYEERIKDPRMLSPFYFDSYAPVLEAEYSVTFPSSVDLAYLLYGQNTEGVVFGETRTGDYTTYTWRARNMPKYAGEENAPEKAYYSPHLILRIQSYRRDGQTVNLLRDETDLYRWYHSLVQKMPNEDETEVRNLVRDLTQGIGQDAEKARVIFDWVQTNIQYVAFEDGMGGFIPRSAQSVCTKRYGDCKDMANLLCRMLNYAGLEAYLTWIGTRSKPYAYHQVPAPIVDNHMIAALILNGQTHFLDATGKYTPFPMPTPMIQGKEALIGIGDDRFEIKKVPAVEKEKNLLVDSTWLAIRDGDLTGKARRYAKGFFQLNLDAQRNYTTEEKDKEKFWNDYLAKGNNKFALRGFSAQSVSADHAAGISIPYDFELPGYARKAGNRILVNLHLNRRLQDQSIDLTKRKYDREFEFRYVHQDINTLQIPEGYAADYLPQSVEYQNDQFGFRIRYNQEDDRIVLAKEIYINTLLLKKEDFAAWNEMIDQLVHAYREVVVLKLL